MQAIRLERFVGPDEIAIVDVDLPAIRTGDALVRVSSAGVNPSDVKYAAGVVADTPLPRIPGRDFAGTVEEGPGDWVGVDVYGTGGDLGIRRDGTHAQYVALPVGALVRKPQHLGMSEAAAVGVPYITAFKAIVEIGALQTGETVLIVGGSGSVGRAAAQMARWVGARIVATCRSGESAAGLADLVDTVVVLPDEDLAAATRAATHGHGAKLVFNTVGGETFEPAVNALDNGGRMVCIAASGDHRVAFDLMTFYKKQMRWFGLDTLDLTATDCAPILDHLRPGFDSGTFSVQVAHDIPLARASEAYGLVARGGAGKVVLTMPSNSF